MHDRKGPTTSRYLKLIDSPVGALTLVANEQSLLMLTWGKCEIDFKIEEKMNHVLAAAEAQLWEYFAGKRTTFNVPLAPDGTEFQRNVWRELAKIPYGKTITYGEQAARLGRPKASRAVGAANGRNPIGIFVPCHRVIGASGALTGFAGGIPAKQRLLALEGISLER